MNRIRIRRGLVLLLAVSGLGLFVAGASSCNKNGGPSCTPAFDGAIPDVDAGEFCSFPCPVASRGSGAGGDTWDTFASPFFATYCVRCHSTTRTANCYTDGSATCRFGSPLGLNWDDPSSVRAHLDQIRDAVGVQTNISMPPDLPTTPDPTKPAPTCEDRFRLTRWIDSGAPGLP